MDDSTWSTTIVHLDSQDIEASVSAADKLYRECTIDDVPRLLSLLDNASCIVREAAAWPLAGLAGPRALPELLMAYQRGFDEGLDNDGFTTALIELAVLHRAEARTALEKISEEATGTLKENADWLLQFCGEEDPS